MKNIYYKKILEAFEPCNTSTYNEIYKACGINPYSGIASDRFRRAWNDYFANGRIERIGSSEPYKYYMNQ